jgi:hypothetical protein
LLIDGLCAAAERVKADGPSSGVAGFAALFETLAWVGVIRERIKEKGNTPPPVLNGLYFLRNLVLHQGIEVLTYVHGYAFGHGPFGHGPFGGSTRIFPSRSELPVHTSKAGLSDYDAMVDGRSVNTVLDELQEALR